MTQYKSKSLPRPQAVKMSNGSWFVPSRRSISSINNRVAFTGLRKTGALSKEVKK